MSSYFNLPKISLSIYFFIVFLFFFFFLVHCVDAFTSCSRLQTAIYQISKIEWNSLDHNRTHENRINHVELLVLLTRFNHPPSKDDPVRNQKRKNLNWPKIGSLGGTHSSVLLLLKFRDLSRIFRARKEHECDLKSQCDTTSGYSLQKMRVKKFCYLEKGKNLVFFCMFVAKMQTQNFWTVDRTFFAIIYQS